MTRFTRVFWLGIATYAASFFLAAMSGPGSTPQHPNLVRGYLLAWWALALPWVSTDLWSQGVGPMLMPLLVASGWTNLVFVASMLALWREQHRVFVVLRILVLLTIPASWVVFYFGFHPREGYFVWPIGTPLALFSPSDQTSAIPPKLFPPRT